MSRVLTVSSEEHHSQHQPRLCAKSVDGLSAEREIGRGTSAPQSDRSLTTSSRERHSASLAADGSIVVVAMLCTSADRIQAECQYLRALRFCSPPHFEGVAWPHSGSKTEGSKEEGVCVCVCVCVCVHM